tara:strand:- start:810 stop:944 length:135 start_codon:yes stop_codon:yes gene_type:complete
MAAIERAKAWKPDAFVAVGGGIGKGKVEEERERIDAYKILEATK